MTQEKFNQLMDNWLQQKAEEGPAAWSEIARDWCESNGIIEGDDRGNKMYKKFLTREEIASVLYKLHIKGII